MSTKKKKIIDLGVVAESSWVNSAFKSTCRMLFETISWIHFVLTFSWVLVSYFTLRLYHIATISSTSSPSRVTSPMLSYENENGVKYWHLVKPSEMEEKGKGPGNRMMAEVYLPRLLTMKVNTTFPALCHVCSTLFTLLLLVLHLTVPCPYSMVMSPHLPHCHPYRIPQCVPG